MTFPMSRMLLCTRFGDRGIHGSWRFVLAQLLGQEFRDDHNLFQLALGQVKAPALFIGPRAVSALFGHFGQGSPEYLHRPHRLRLPAARASMSLSLIAALISRKVDKRAAALSFMACFSAADYSASHVHVSSHPRASCFRNATIAIAALQRNRNVNS